jgi:imidazolonepropionase-like amidohydrolase
MGRTVLRGGRVYDVVSGTAASADVVVSDGVVVEVGTSLDGDDAVSIDGLTVLPGFIDCHVHMMASHLDDCRAVHEPFSLQFYEGARNLALTLAAGVTTARDAAGADAGVREAVRLGLVIGPRLLISVNIISQTGGHAETWVQAGGPLPLPYALAHPGRPEAIADGPEELRRVVRLLVRAGADWIKLAASGGVLSPGTDSHRPHLQQDELLAIVRESEHSGRWAMAHAHSAAGIIAAVRAGVRSIEHGTYLDDEGAALMAERGAWLVPTLVAAHGVIDAAAQGVDFPPGVLDKANEAAAAASSAVARAHDAGVQIALGTDAPVWPHGRNLHELELLVAAGLPPADALRAGTVNGARLLGLGERIGRVEPGFAADLCLVSGDPLDVQDLGGRVEQVWTGGTRVV